VATVDTNAGNIIVTITNAFIEVSAASAASIGCEHLLKIAVVSGHFAAGLLHCYLDSITAVMGCVGEDSTKYLSLH